jgi:phospholipid-binding lipoprotein MlaA
LLGPSNPRDAAGRVVDIFLDPLTYIGVFTDVPVLSHSYFTIPRTGLEALDFRARNLKTLDEIRKGSLDYYATLRSLYRQSREDEIRNSIPSTDSIGPGGLAPEEAPTSEAPTGKTKADQTSQLTPVTPPKLSFLAVDGPITKTAGQ